MTKSHKYDAKERELILSVMDLFISNPDYARKLDFDDLHFLFPELSTVFDFMLSDEFEDKTKLHSIVDALPHKGLQRMLTLAKGYYD